ncbi:MAG: hypothetical protein R3E79_59945 [Caldilineaceae bacterium]
MVQPNAILLSTEVADPLWIGRGRHSDDSSRQPTPGVDHCRSAGPSDELSRRALAGLLITDIAAQELLDRVGRLDRITTCSSRLLQPIETALQQIAAILPPGARIEPSAARSGTKSRR